MDRKSIRKNKKDALVETARGLFYRYGIRKVAIEEICAEAKVSKMTFYKYFANRMELAKEVLDGILDRAIRQFSDMMESDISFEEKMQGVLQMKIENAKDASVAFIIDIYRGPDVELVEHTLTWIRRGKQLAVDYFMNAQRQGYIRKGISPALMLVLLDKMQELALDDRVLATCGNLQDLVVEITKLFLYGIMENEN
ncbi:MAG: TetR/AcrR family transcriptional regulator [Tannerella sp.]|jgi:AcrR family transcriptional regulator|nr:TetR/AcrR family transcriptional regulator [Tannerella sp.]